MNEIDKFLNSDLKPYERFEITNNNSPKAIREYLEGLGCEYDGRVMLGECGWWNFYNSSIDKTLTLYIDVDELKMWLYWRG